MALLCFCRLSWIFVLWMRIKADITVLFWCCLSLSRLVFCRSRSRRIPSPLRSTKNFPSGWGLVFCCDTSKLSLHEVKTTKRSKSAEKKKKKKRLTNEKDAGRVTEKYFMVFQDVFWKFSSCCLPQAKLKFKGKQKTQFLSHFLV